MHATNLICSSMTINMFHCDKSLNCSQFKLAYQLECGSVFFAYYFKCNF
uniref:Alternative protein PCLO n=1 Tax=Homo sapiens TaxID=9606 RepID=L8E9M5_HUMAN|nr:alternative protein PCLO [Homo sapiens]